MISRLAPSPTGVLHLGNARSFLLNWLYLRSKGGTLLLRIEDIDGPRTKPGAEANICEDLRWLGLDWDGDALRQSDRLGRYHEVAQSLLAKGLAYPCICSRREVEEAASAPHEDWQDAVAYPGTCRGRFASLGAARRASSQEPALRIVAEPGPEPFVDLFAGHQDGSIRGDFVIQKRDGGPAYQLAVVVDDIASGVDLVVRGADLLPSTPRQLQLYRHLGAITPRYMHLPLLTGPDGKRLAKRHGDTSLRWFRAKGVSAPALVGYLAAISGMVPAGTECMPADLLKGFDISCVPPQEIVAMGRGLLP